MFPKSVCSVANLSKLNFRILTFNTLRRLRNSNNSDDDSFPATTEIGWFRCYWTVAIVHSVQHFVHSSPLLLGRHFLRLFHHSGAQYEFPEKIQWMFTSIQTPPVDVGIRVYCSFWDGPSSSASYRIGLGGCCHCLELRRIFYSNMTGKELGWWNS